MRIIPWNRASHSSNIKIPEIITCTEVTLHIFIYSFLATGMGSNETRRTGLGRVIGDDELTTNESMEGQVFYDVGWMGGTNAACDNSLWPHIPPSIRPALTLGWWGWWSFHHFSHPPWWCPAIRAGFVQQANCKHGDWIGGSLGTITPSMSTLLHTETHRGLWAIERTWMRGVIAIPNGRCAHQRHSCN